MRGRDLSVSRNIAVTGTVVWGVCLVLNFFYPSSGSHPKCRPFRRRRRHRQRKIGMTSLIRTGRRYHVSVDRGRGCSTRIGSFQNWCRPETLLPTHDAMHHHRRRLRPRARRIRPTAAALHARKIRPTAAALHAASFPSCA